MWDGDKMGQEMNDYEGGEGREGGNIEKEWRKKRG